MTATDIPLFPLNSVLFPGGVLELRVFERRYLDLVRDCARSGAGFGVCLILHGREAGEPAVPAFSEPAAFLAFAPACGGACRAGGRLRKY